MTTSKIAVVTGATGGMGREIILTSRATTTCMRWVAAQTSSQAWTT